MTIKGHQVILLVTVTLGVTFFGILYVQTQMLEASFDDSLGHHELSFQVREIKKRKANADGEMNMKPEETRNDVRISEVELKAIDVTARTPDSESQNADGNSKVEAFTFGNLQDVKGMSSCLFIMDDTIRLIEWLAYHFTVLPLRYLIVGIDPHSTHPDRIVEVLDRWRPYINITIWDDPQTYLANVPWDKAWKRKYWISPGVVNPLYFNTTSYAYKSQEHKRRQNIFTTYCYREHYLSNRDWVINLDTDEYLIPNYIGQYEDTNSSNFVIHYVGTDEKLERDRRNAMRIRENLPDLTKRVTISEMLHQTEFDRCLKIPALNFTSHRGEKEYKGEKDKTGKLLTLLQTKSGPREGRTTKAILDVSRAQLSYLTWQKFVNVHNPNKRMCGWNGVIGSGTDYISSTFRYHHYVAGSLETALERTEDYRMRESGIALKAHFESRNFEPVIEETTDIHPWLDWFLDIVGDDVAQVLLFSPLEQSYARMRTLLEKQLLLNNSYLESPASSSTAR